MAKAKMTQMRDELTYILREYDVGEVDDVLVSSLIQWQGKYSGGAKATKATKPKKQTGIRRWWSELMTIGTKGGVKDFKIHLDSEVFDELAVEARASEKAQTQLEMLEEVCDTFQGADKDAEISFQRMSRALGELAKEKKMKGGKAKIHSWLKPFISDETIAKLRERASMKSAEKIREIGMGREMERKVVDSASDGSD